MNHQKYMQEALAEARSALAAEEFPVGCVLVQDGEIVARGHRRNSRAGKSNEIDHAEVVTLRRLLSRHPDIDCSSLVAYCTMEPCLMCYSTMLLSGIRHFVYGYEDMMGGGLNLPLYQLNPLYAQMQVQVEAGVLRNESLALFQQFFRNFSYWQDSLLSQYTLAQPLQDT
ncbi:MAG: nucleoside deaminase [Desulfobulbaceae bacterium]|nr:nucleoside deaminase [Desulfobulbaceae bacterium]